MRALFREVLYLAEISFVTGQKGDSLQNKKSRAWSFVSLRSGLLSQLLTPEVL